MVIRMAMAQWYIDRGAGGPLRVSPLFTDLIGRWRAPRLPVCVGVCALQGNVRCHFVICSRRGPIDRLVAVSAVVAVARV